MPVAITTTVDRTAADRAESCSSSAADAAGTESGAESPAARSRAV